MIIAPFMNIVFQARLNKRCARILVCGGRTYTDKNKVWTILNEVVQVCEDRPLGYAVVIIHGGARGADLLADQWAVCNWSTIDEYRADWQRYESAAGQVRNRKMLKEGKPDMVIAFPGGTATAHMVGIAKDAGVPVLEVE